MDENLSRGYVQLGKARGAGDLRFTTGFSHLSPPVDKYDGIYYSLVLAGVGFLLPYNSFIIAVDYFQMQYPGTTIVLDMSLVYIIMAFFAVLANNLLVEALSLNTRITFGYIVSFITLLFVAVFEVWWGIFSTRTSYTVNLIAVAVVALGCTVQQSSFYGYTSMLPSRYTQAVMAGEKAFVEGLRLIEIWSYGKLVTPQEEVTAAISLSSVVFNYIIIGGAGLLVSVNRILTKMLLKDQKANTLTFFAISVLIVGMCFALHQVVRQTDFVQFYLTLCRESKKITLEPTEDAGLMEPGETGEGKGSQYGVLKLQAASPLDSSASGHFSFSNPVYEPSASSGPTYKVEDVVVRMTGDSPSYRKPSSTKPWPAIQRGMKARWEVAQTIWHYMLVISLVYMVTLSLYPGIEAEIVSCKFGTWMPVILMATFNASDLIGKMIASLVYDWSKARLLIFALARVVMIPSFLLCAMPRDRPITPGEGYPIFLSMMLGLTNGVIGSVPMIQAPSRVAEQHRELTGNIMTLSYNFGLTAGSLLAYVFEAMLGPPLRNPCGEGPAPTDHGISLHNLTTAIPTTTTPPSTALITTLLTTLATTALPLGNFTSLTSTSTVLPLNFTLANN